MRRNSVDHILHGLTGLDENDDTTRALQLPVAYFIHLIPSFSISLLSIQSFSVRSMTHFTISSTVFAPIIFVPFASFARNSSTFDTVRLNATTCAYTSFSSTAVKTTEKTKKNFPCSHREAVIVHVEDEILSHDSDSDNSNVGDALIFRPDRKVGEHVQEYCGRQFGQKCASPNVRNHAKVR